MMRVEGPEGGQEIEIPEGFSPRVRTPSIFSYLRRNRNEHLQKRRNRRCQISQLLRAAEAKEPALLFCHVSAKELVLPVIKDSVVIPQRFFGRGVYMSTVNCRSNEI